MPEQCGERRIGANGAVTERKKRWLREYLLKNLFRCKMGTNVLWYGIEYSRKRVLNPNT